MSKRTILFIDGNNLYHNLKQIKVKPLDLDFLKFSDFICAYFNIDKDHIIYYNSIPRMGDPSFFRHKEFLDDLERQNIEVKTRMLQVKSSIEIKKRALALIENMNLCNKCKPIVITNLFNWIGDVVKKEKGIDVMIAVDLIQNTIEKKYDYYVVVSGDVDLVTAMEFAGSKGGKIFSAFINSGYSSEIRSKFRHFTIDRSPLLKNCIKEIIT